LPVSWPKDGVVLVFCKGGKYCADLVHPDLDNVSEVLADLKKQAATQERKESLQRLCKEQVNKRFRRITSPETIQ
jgi:hypothetical protein